MQNDFGVINGGRYPIRVGPTTLPSHPIRSNPRRPARLGLIYLAMWPDIWAAGAAHCGLQQRPMPIPFRPPPSLYPSRVFGRRHCRVPNWLRGRYRTRGRRRPDPKDPATCSGDLRDRVLDPRRG